MPIQTYQTAFERELRTAIDLRLSHLIATLITSSSITDYPAYREQVGRIQAFQEIASMCDDTNDIIQKQARGDH